MVSQWVGVKHAHLLLLLALVPCFGCRKSSFERKQARAEAANPHWLSIELDTDDGRHSYKESEFIKFNVGYSSAVRELYKAETGEGYSIVAASDVLHISDGTDAPLNTHGIVCCGSRIMGLNDEAYVYHAPLRIRLKPGTYEMYITTHRVFPWDIAPEVYTNSEWETASKMLSIRVVPDPGWQERTLASILAKPIDPASCSMLSSLDIPAATAKKLDFLHRGVSCGYGGAIFNQTEYPIALKGMDEMMQSPDYGVSQRDANLVLELRMWIEHPEHRHPPREREEYDKWYASDHLSFVEAEKSLVQELCGTLPVKLADAKTTTQHTIDGLTANRLDRIPNCK